MTKRRLLVIPNSSKTTVHYQFGKQVLRRRSVAFVVKTLLKETMSGDYLAVILTTRTVSTYGYNEAAFVACVNDPLIRHHEGGARSNVSSFKFCFWGTLVRHFFSTFVL